MESYLQLWYWPSAVQWCVDHACLSWVSSHPNQYRFSSFAIPHHIGHSSINRDGESEGGQPLGAADYAMPHWFVIIHVPTRVWHFSRRAATGKVTSFSGKEKGKDEIWKSSRNMKKGEGNVNFTNAALYPSFSHHLVPNNQKLNKCWVQILWKCKSLMPFVSNMRWDSERILWSLRLFCHLSVYVRFVFIDEDMDNRQPPTPVAIIHSPRCDHVSSKPSTLVQAPSRGCFC